jgi:hypothetical protein
MRTIAAMTIAAAMNPAVHFLRRVIRFPKGSELTIGVSKTLEDQILGKHVNSQL